MSRAVASEGIGAALYEIYVTDPLRFDAAKVVEDAGGEATNPTMSAVPRMHVTKIRYASVRGQGEAVACAAVLWTGFRMGKEACWLYEPDSRKSTT